MHKINQPSFRTILWHAVFPLWSECHYLKRFTFRFMLPVMNNRIKTTEWTPGLCTAATNCTREKRSRHLYTCSPSELTKSLKKLLCLERDLTRARASQPSKVYRELVRGYPTSQAQNLYKHKCRINVETLTLTFVFIGHPFFFTLRL